MRSCSDEFRLPIWRLRSEWWPLPFSSMNSICEGRSAGLVFGFLGVIGLWTAVDMTGVFVAAAVVVQVIEFALAGAFLALYREAPSRRLSLMAVTVAGGLAIGGIVVQNLLGA
jgi:hypothetical protein